MCSDRSRRRAGAAWRGVSTAQIRLHARAPRLAISHRRNDYFIRFYQISDLVYGSTYFLVGIVRIRTRRVDFSRELDSRAPRKTMLGANLRRPNCRLSFGKLHTRARAVARKGLEDFQKTGVPAKTKGSNWSSRTPYRNVFALLTRHGLPGRVTGLFFHPQIHSRDSESRRCRGVTTAHSCQFTVVVILPVYTCPRKPCNPRRWRHTLRCTRTIKSYELVPVAVTLHTMVPPSTERGNAAARTLFSRRD